MSAIQVKIRLFGAFRNFIEQPEVELAVPSGTSLADLKPALARHLQGGDRIQALLAESAFADEKRVLLDSETLAANVRLAVLPPVCGG